MSLLRHARQDPQVHYDFIAQDGDFDDDFDDDDEEDLRMVDKPDRLSRWSEEEEEEEQLNLPPAQATIPVVQKLNTKTTAVGKNEPRLRW